MPAGSFKVYKLVRSESWSTGTSWDSVTNSTSIFSIALKREVS